MYSYSQIHIFRVKCVCVHKQTQYVCVKAFKTSIFKQGNVQITKTIHMILNLYIHCILYNEWENLHSKQNEKIYYTKG
jgi:hypothetical protein